MSRGQSKILSILVMVSLLVNVIAIYELAIAFRQNSVLRKQTETLLDQIENLTKSVMNLLRENENLKSQVEYYRSQLEQLPLTSEGAKGGATLSGRSRINLVAVKAVYKHPLYVGYEGVTLKCYVELKEGSGRVLVNTKPYIGIDLQVSTQVAASVARNITGKDLSGTDIIITIEANEEIYVVDGPSAGAAITIAIIAAIRGDNLSDKVFITGTISADGTIGMVGGIAEKAEAAALSGGTIFLVPMGQEEIIIYRRVERRVGIVTIVTLEPVEIRLEKYLQEKGYNMTVVGVSSITEAYKYFVNFG
ncbi:MAG: S16 family serine protease [Candidatus Bathyarchaeia archaeon]